MKTSQKPILSVVMAVYNGMPYLEDAVKSILAQTYKNFEFIIVDDGSTDDGWRYLKSLKDQRIKLIKNAKNLGLASSLNIGLKAAKGEYIARMDADDTSLPQRFKKQVDFLNANDNYTLVGSQVEWVDQKNKRINGFIVPQTDEEIRKKIVLRNQIHHATVMFRKSDIQKLGAYRTFFNGVEDYDLWFRVIGKGMISNLPEKLVIRRIHPKALSQKNHIRTELFALAVRFLNIPKLI